jgi:hypothetical protein
MKKEFSVRLRLTESERSTLASVTPEGFSEHATLRAIFRIGVSHAQLNPEGLLACLKGFQTRAPRRKSLTEPEEPKCPPVESPSPEVLISIDAPVTVGPEADPL